MPVNNGLGYGKYTEGKQDHFRKILQLHMDIVRAIKGEWSNGYTYIDMNAGSGYYEGITGSPLIFLEECERIQKRWNALFIEKESVHAEVLCEKVGTLANVSVRNEDHWDVLREFREKKQLGLGLIYHDPSGNIPEFELLSEISNYKAFERMDIMIYLAATSIKRDRGAHPDTGKYLMDYIHLINKKSWIVRQYTGIHQWTFVIGSNWNRFPDWKKIGFHRLEEDVAELKNGQDPRTQGGAIMNRLNYSSKELAKRSGQLCLF